MSSYPRSGMNPAMRIGVFGFLSWLIPFLAAVPFFSREGELLINLASFKILMFLVGGSTGSFFLVRHLRTGTDHFLRRALQAAVPWMLLNWALDHLVLVPMSPSMNLAKYWTEIGLVYLYLPISAVAIGWTADRAAEHARASAG